MLYQSQKRNPKKITPCPIIEGIFEVRYKRNPKISSNTLPGLLAAKMSFPESNDLPEANIPEKLASRDPHLRYQPRTQLLNDDFIIQLGPKVLSVNNPDNYVGWSKFSLCIYETIQAMLEMQAFEDIERIGLRYIDFFEKNIFEHINLKINMNETHFSSQDMFFQYATTTEHYRAIVKITNHIKLTSGKKNLTGSTIDIDTHYLHEIPTDKKTIIDIIEGAHEFEKDIFYDLIHPEFLKTLNPEYHDDSSS